VTTEISFPLILEVLFYTSYYILEIILMILNGNRRGLFFYRVAKPNFNLKFFKQKLYLFKSRFHNIKV